MWMSVSLQLAEEARSFQRNLRLLYANREMDTFTVKYEDFRNPALAEATLTGALDFLCLGDRTSPPQIRCAFALAEHGEVHRRSSPSDEFMQKPRAYSKDVVCSMWAVMGKEAELRGYAPYQYKC
jgi:hypothetical protein